MRRTASARSFFTSAPRRECGGPDLRAGANRFFVNHKGLDYAVVAVKATALNGAPLRQFQYLPLIAVKGKIVRAIPSISFSTRRAPQAVRHGQQPAAGPPGRRLSAL